MLVLKRFFALIVVAAFAVSTLLAQTDQSAQAEEESSDEMSVEESYLQEAVEMMVIRETSRADSREQKLIALEYIGGALERGSTNDEIRTTLEYLAMEGTQNKVRERGRLMNDYPEVRRMAAKYLGDVGTEEAKSALIRICITESEPMVLQEAIKSLGVIGTDENDASVSTIVWVANRFNNDPNMTNNLLALASIDAIDKLTKDNGIKDPGAIQLLTKIAEGPYATPVKDRAKQAIVDLLKSNAKQRQQQNENEQQSVNAQ